MPSFMEICELIKILSREAYMYRHDTVNFFFCIEEGRLKVFTAVILALSTNARMMKMIIYLPEVLKPLVD
jgi:hypothetical protein